MPGFIVKSLVHESAKYITLVNANGAANNTLLHTVPLYTHKALLLVLSGVGFLLAIQCMAVSQCWGNTLKQQYTCVSDHVLSSLTVYCLLTASTFIIRLVIFHSVL